MKNKKSRIIALVIGTVVTCAMAGVLTACGGDSEAYKPGDVVIDSQDVKYTIDADGNVIETEYSGKDITVKYLLDNNSYVLLEGKKADELSLTKYVGDLTEVSLKTIEENVKIEDTPISITSIGKKAFYGCDTIQTLDLSKNAKSLSFDINSEAFAYCSNLQTVTLPENVYVDYNKIGENAFAYCENLQTISVGDKFAVVEKGAFAYCTSLNSIALSPKQKVIEEGTFLHCDKLSSVTFSDEIRSINAGAFAYTGISNLDLNKYTKLRRIGESAFMETKLSSINLPDSITYVGDYAFFNCYSLANISVPFIGNQINQAPSKATFNSIYGAQRITTDGSSISSAPMRLIDVTVGTVTSIPAELSSNNEQIKSLTVKSYLTPGTYYVYNSASSGDHDNYDGIAHTAVTVTSNEIKYTVGYGAFQNCENLRTVSLPDETTEFGEYAFANCEVLTSPKYPASLKKIGANAFQNCKALTEVKIGGKITQVGSKAFSGCTNVKTVTVDKANGLVLEKEDGGKIYNAQPFSLTVSDWFDVYTGDNSGNSNSMNYVSTIKIGSAFMIPDDMFKGFSNATSIEVTINDFTEEEKAYLKKENPAMTTISSEIGDEAFAYCRSLPSSGLKITDANGIISAIGSRAFLRCENLTSYTVPANITNMGNAVFQDCTSLSSLTVEKFNSLNNSNLVTLNNWFGTSTTFDSASYSGLYQPENHGSYNTVYVPNALRTVTLGDVVQLPNYMFEGWKLNTLSLTFRSGLAVSNTNVYQTTVGSYALSHLDYLNTLTINGAENVKVINNSAFANTASVNVGIVNSFSMVRIIRSNAFAHTMLNGAVNLPATLETVESNAFHGCPSISVLNIGNPACFSGSIARIFTNIALSDIGNAEENNYVKVSGDYGVPVALKTVTVSGLQNIGSLSTSLLSNIPTIEKVSLASESKDTYYYMNGNNPFSGCTGLKKVFLPDTITAIYLANGTKAWGADGNTYFELGNQGGATPTVYQYAYSQSSIADYGNYWTGTSSDPEICNKPTTDGVVAVTFNYGVIGEDPDAPETTKPGEVTKGVVNAAPSAPANEGYTIVGYYTDLNDLSSRVSFPYFSGIDTTLYAKWVENANAEVEYDTATSFNVTSDANGVTLNSSASSANASLNVWADKQISVTVTLYRSSSSSTPYVNFMITPVNGESFTRTVSNSVSSTSKTVTFAYNVTAGNQLTIDYYGNSSYNDVEINIAFNAPVSVTAPTIPTFETFKIDMKEVVGDVKGTEITDDNFRDALGMLYADPNTDYDGLLSYHGMSIIGGVTTTVNSQILNGNTVIYVEGGPEQAAGLFPMYIVERYGNLYVYAWQHQTKDGATRWVKLDSSFPGYNELCEMLIPIVEGNKPEEVLPELENLGTSKVDTETNTRYITVTENNQTVVLAVTKINGKYQISLGFYTGDLLVAVYRYDGLNSTTVTEPANWISYGQFMNEMQNGDMSDDMYD